MLEDASVRRANPLQVGKIHPGKKRAADQVPIRDESPIAAIGAVIAVIPHDKILAWRYGTDHALQCVGAMIFEREIVCIDNNAWRSRIFQQDMAARIHGFTV